MNTALWVLQDLLTVLFIATGGMKLLRPINELRESLGGWVDDVSPGLIRVVGGLEVAAALGLVLPPALRVLPWLSPLAAGGLTLIMLGAAYVHGRRGGETGHVIGNLTLAVVTAALCWARFGPYPFN